MLSVEPWSGQAPLSTMTEDGDLNLWLWYHWQLCLLFFLNALLFNGVLWHVCLDRLRYTLRALRNEVTIEHVVSPARCLSFCRHAHLELAVRESLSMLASGIVSLSRNTEWIIETVLTRSCLISAVTWVRSKSQEVSNLGEFLGQVHTELGGSSQQRVPGIAEMWLGMDLREHGAYSFSSSWDVVRVLSGLL